MHGWCRCPGSVLIPAVGCVGAICIHGPLPASPTLPVSSAVTGTPSRSAFATRLAHAQSGLSEI